jgi:hypothetical protein
MIDTETLCQGDVNDIFEVKIRCLIFGDASILYKEKNDRIYQIEIEHHYPFVINALEDMWSIALAELMLSVVHCLQILSPLTPYHSIHPSSTQTRFSRDTITCSNWAHHRLLS